MFRTRDVIDLGRAGRETKGQGLLITDDAGKRNQAGLDREQVTLDRATAATRGMGFLVGDDVGKQTQSGLARD